MDKVKQMPERPDKFRAAVEEMKRSLPAYIEMGSVLAEIRREHYDAYIEKGFTPEQALELSKKLTP